MDYYDLHVYSSLTTGETPTEEMVAMAKRLGFKGIAIAGMKDKGQYDIDIVSSCLIEAKNAQDMIEQAKKYRNSYEILMVAGGDYDINRTACENPMIDVLCHPGKGRGDSGLDHISIKAAKENNVAIEINMRELIENYRKRRVRVLEGVKKNVFLCRKFGTPIVTCSGAMSKWNMRAGRELASVANMLGMEIAEAIGTVSTVPEHIISINREKIAGKRWEGLSIYE